MEVVSDILNTFVQHVRDLPLVAKARCYALWVELVSSISNTLEWAKLMLMGCTCYCFCPVSDSGSVSFPW